MPPTTHRSTALDRALDAIDERFRPYNSAPAFVPLHAVVRLCAIAAHLTPRSATDAPICLDASTLLREVWLCHERTYRAAGFTPQTLETLILPVRLRLAKQARQRRN